MAGIKPPRPPKFNRTAELTPHDRVLVQLGVTSAAYLYSRGLKVDRSAFTRAVQEWEIDITFGEVDLLFTPGPVGSAFLELCLERGLIDPTSGKHSGLTAKQMVGLAKVSNVLDRKPLSRKLQEINVEWWEWQTWLANPIFSAAYRDLAEKNIERHQATVLDALTANAVAGDLRSIEYFNKMSGRFDPTQQVTQDARTVVTAIVDILEETLSGQPELLQTLGDKIQKRLNPTKQVMIEGVGEVL